MSHARADGAIAHARAHVALASEGENMRVLAPVVWTQRAGLHIRLGLGVGGSTAELRAPNGALSARTQRLLLPSLLVAWSGDAIAGGLHLARTNRGRRFSTVTGVTRPRDAALSDSQTAGAWLAKRLGDDVALALSGHAARHAEFELLHEPVESPAEFQATRWSAGAGASLLWAPTAWPIEVVAGAALDVAGSATGTAPPVGSVVHVGGDTWDVGVASRFVRDEWSVEVNFALHHRAVSHWQFDRSSLPTAWPATTAPRFGFAADRTLFDGALTLHAGFSAVRDPARAIIDGTTHPGPGFISGVGVDGALGPIRLGVGWSHEWTARAPAGSELRVAGDYIYIDVEWMSPSE